MTEVITGLQDLRAGDIFLGPIGGIVGLGVGIGEFFVDGGFRIGELDVRHAGIVVESGSEDGIWADDPPLLAQAMPRGAEVVPMTPAKHWTERCLYVRLPEDYPGQAFDAANVARLMVKMGVAYSFASYASLALHEFTGGWPSLDRWIARRRSVQPNDWPGATPMPPTLRGVPVEAICSVFVDQAWTLAGKRVMANVTPQAVTPSRLATTLLSTDGAVFGWPGRHPWTPAL